MERYDSRRGPEGRADGLTAGRSLGYHPTVMHTPLLAGVLLTLAAAALPAQTDTAPPPPPPRPPKSSSTLITEDDVDKVRASAANAFDVVRLLRPRWLRQTPTMLPPRQGSSSSQVQDLHVYVNDHEMGGLDFLKSLPAEQIYTLRFLSVTEIGARYGPSSGPGIVVTLRH